MLVCVANSVGPNLCGYPRSVSIQCVCKLDFKPLVLVVPTDAKAKTLQPLGCLCLHADGSLFVAAADRLLLDCVAGQDCLHEIKVVWDANSMPRGCGWVNGWT